MKNNADDLKQDLKIIKLKIEELEQGLNDYYKKVAIDKKDQENKSAPKILSLNDKIDELKNKIENIEARIDLLLERKKRIETIVKKEIEEKELNAKTPSEKREAEKERHLVEDESNFLEKEIENKKNELNDLKYQYKELNKFRFDNPVTNLDFQEDPTYTALSEERQNLLWELQKINNKTKELKKLIAEATSQKHIIENRLSQILNSETKSENEIKLIEEKLAQGIFENDSKKLEEDRRKIEERRRETEESRWEAEDELEKIKNVLANLKAEYDVFPSQINNIKEKLKIINQKMDEKTASN